MNYNMEEIVTELISEVRYLKEQIEILKGRDLYQQLLTKYNEPIVDTIPDEEFEYEGKIYRRDKNNNVWDSDGYLVKDIEIPI